MYIPSHEAIAGDGMNIGFDGLGVFILVYVACVYVLLHCEKQRAFYCRALRQYCKHGRNSKENSKKPVRKNPSVRSIRCGVPLHEQVALGNDWRNHARLQLLARQVVILQVAVFIAERLAVVQRAGKDVRHVALRLKRIARITRIVPAVAALVARLRLIGLHDLGGVVRQVLAVLRV
jgi:hypothetical protein